jgi:hypothetical protein
MVFINNFTLKYCLNSRSYLLFICFSAELQSQLTKYLLRTLCSDIVNLLVIHFSTEDSTTIATPEVNNKVVYKLIKKRKKSFRKNLFFRHV